MEMLHKTICRICLTEEGETPLSEESNGKSYEQMMSCLTNILVYLFSYKFKLRI